MGNSSITDQKILTSKNSKQHIVVNNALYRNNRKSKLSNYSNNKKKKDLDLFGDIVNDKNEFKEVNKTKNGCLPKIITKNYFNNNENNINFLRMINENPIKKIKNEMEKNKNDNSNSNKDKIDIKNEFNAINFTLNDNSFDNEIKNENIENDIKKINKNLYEFESNNKYFRYSNKKKQNQNQKSEETLSSGRTINNMNSEGEFFFDNINNKDDKLKNTNTNKIFSNITKYEFRKNNCNKNNGNKLIGMNKANNNKNIKYKRVKDSEKNNIKIKIDNIKYNNNKYRKINAKSKQENRANTNNSIIKIQNTNNNNVLLISNFLTNKVNSRNKINKKHSSCRNNTFNLKENININQDFSFKNLSNNIHKCNNNIISYKESNKKKLSKEKNNKKNINLRTNKYFDNNNNNYSYNYNNINNEKNNNFYEKQKIVELIDKIPNSELKNEIMNLYQKIINYNNDIIINNKNSKFDYIITFSNNYIKKNENKTFKKEYNKKNLYIRNAIKISLLSFKQNTNKSKSSSKQINSNQKKNISINLISNIHKDSNSKNNINKIKYNKSDNLIINNMDNESIFKKYTYEQYKKSGNAKLNSAKKYFDQTTPELNSRIKSIETIKYCYSNKDREKNKIKINSVNNKAWKKIINLNEVTISKDKIYPFTVIEQSNSNLFGSEPLFERDKRDYSLKYKSKKEKINNIINREKTSKSIDIFKYRDKINDLDKFDKFYSFTLAREKIFFQKNMKKLIKVESLLKDIKKSSKNYTFKEDDLVLFNVICLLSRDYIMIFKDKEKNHPLFKKRIGLIQKIMSFRKNRKFILIAEFGDLNEQYAIKNNKEEKDKYLGLLIDKEKYYNEFIDLLTQLKPDLEIVFLN